jgi:hypothetical protein
LEQIGAGRLQAFDAEFCHPTWLEAKRHIGETVSGGLGPAFLDDPVLRPQMVRRGWSDLQSHEERYLLSRDGPLARIPRDFRESRIGSPHLECSRYECSSNSLGHLYYLVRTLERFDELQGTRFTTIEFGGGYGNFARVCRELPDPGPHVILDFPELLAVQSYFLGLNGIETRICTSISDAGLDSQVVYLAPVHLIDEIRPRADLFVSHFGLSEAPRALQALIAERSFFDCRFLYLTGQYGGQQPGERWEPHGPMHSEIREQFGDFQVEDFPVSWGYELSASRERTASGR